MKIAISLLIICLAIENASPQGTIPVKGYFKNNFVFESGYWVYRDTINNDIDSITLTNCTHNFVSPNPVFPDYQEYYRMEYYSHTYAYSYNDYIITAYWKRNGGGIYGELGQPIMHIGQFDQYPEVGNGFNGYEIIAIINALEVNGNVFTDVVVSRVYSDDQYQYEFDYDTDLYFAPGVGIIREEYTDSLGVHHVRDLTNWQADMYTGIDERLPDDENIVLYPNPAEREVTIMYQGMTGIELVDIGCKSILKSDCKCDKFVMDVKAVLPGIYFIKVISDKNVLVKKIVIH